MNEFIHPQSILRIFNELIHLFFFRYNQAHGQTNRSRKTTGNPPISEDYLRPRWLSGRAFYAVKSLSGVTNRHRTRANSFTHTGYKGTGAGRC